MHDIRNKGLAAKVAVISASEKQMQDLRNSKRSSFPKKFKQNSPWVALLPMESRRGG